MKYVLAIDEGTSGATCLMIGEDGRVAGRGYREIPQYFPKPGWVEHNATEILDCVRLAAREAIEKVEREARERRAAVEKVIRDAAEAAERKAERDRKYAARKARQTGKR